MLVAGAVSVIANGFPYKLGLLVAVFADMLAAMATEAVLEKRKSGRKARHG